MGIDFGGKAMLITGGLGAIAEHIVRKIVAADATVILVDIKSSECPASNAKVNGVPPCASLTFRSAPAWAKARAISM